jgi:hypothetical protein
MASEPVSFPPGTGAFRPAEDKRFVPGDHMSGWNVAIQNALDNFGRAPGRYHAGLDLSATVDVKNPGNVIEYIAKFV